MIIKKFIVKTFLLGLMIIVSLSIHAQNQYVDSLRKVLQTGKEDTNRVLALVEMSWETKDNKTSMQYAAEGLALADKLNYNKGKARAYNRMGRINYELHNDSLALKNYFIAANIRKQTNKADNLWGNLLSIGDVYIRENNLAKAKKYYDEGLEITKKYATVDQLLDAYFQTSISYNRVHYYAEAINNMENIVEFYRKKNNKGATAGAYSLLATIYTEQYNYPEAIQNFNNGFKLYNEIGDKKDAANMLQYIGNWYSTMGNDSDAIKYQLASVKMRGQVDDKAGMAMSHITMSQMYRHKGRYNEAFKEVEAALRLYEQPGTPNWGATMCFLMIGGLYENLGDSAAAKGDKTAAAIKYSTAKNYYVTALQKDKENSSGQEGDGYSALGAIHVKLKNLPLAKSYLDSALKISLEFDNKRLLKDCYQNLATLDSLQGNFSQAYFHHIKYISYRDSLNNEENAKKLVEIKMQTEFDQKQETLKAEQGEKDAEAKRIRNQQFFIILALGVVVLAVIVIALIQFRNNKQKQKANLLLHEQKQKIESTLSELKSTQAQLIQSEKMASLGELTAGIAHEIQNPLNFVNNFSEVNNELIEELKAERSTLKAKEQDELLNDIFQNNEKIAMHGKRADAIVKGMLQHSRKSEGTKEPTDINALCDEYLRLSYHGLRAKDKNFNADFKTEFDETIGKINIVPQDIGRVLLNLFNNSFYATSEEQKAEGLTPNTTYKPLVFVQTKKINDKIEIKVEDNGNGIPSNIIDKIFQPFFTTKPTGQGTGLGLSLAYDIITKEHNGTIKAESKEGEGSMFIITLPKM